MRLARPAAFVSVGVMIGYGVFRLLEQGAFTTWQALEPVPGEPLRILTAAHAPIYAETTTGTYLYDGWEGWVIADKPYFPQAEFDPAMPCRATGTYFYPTTKRPRHLISCFTSDWQFVEFYSRQAVGIDANGTIWLWRHDIHFFTTVGNCLVSIVIFGAAGYAANAILERRKERG